MEQAGPDPWDVALAEAKSGPHIDEAEFAERMRWRQLGALMDVNEAFPLPGGMYLDIEDGPESEPDGFVDDLALCAHLQNGRMIANAFGLKPWDIGAAPVPRRIRIWRKLTLARWRVGWMRHAEKIHRALGDPVD